MTGEKFGRSVPSVMSPLAPIHACGAADGKPSKPAAAHRAGAASTSVALQELGHGFLAFLWRVVLMVAMSGVTAGVLWLRKEMPNPYGAVAEREAKPVEARSLKTLAKPLARPQVVAFAAKTRLLEDAEVMPAGAAPEGRAAEIGQVWPREVELKEPPRVGEVFQDPKTKSFIYRTEHFEFSCDVPLGPEVVRHFAGVFEATHLLARTLPLNLKPKPEAQQKFFRVRVASTEAAYTAAGGHAGSGGFYSGNDRCLHVPMATLGVKMAGKRVVLDRAMDRNDALMREITQQIMGRWLPVWMTEGVKEYAVAAEYAQGRFSLGQMQDRMKNQVAASGEAVPLVMLGVAELLAMTPKTWAADLGKGAAEESLARVSVLLLASYLYHVDRDGAGGGVIAMVRALEKGMAQDDAAREFVLAGRSPEAFEEEMKAALARSGIDVRFVKRQAAE